MLYNSSDKLMVADYIFEAKNKNKFLSIKSNLLTLLEEEKSIKPN